MTFEGDIARFVTKTFVRQKFIFFGVANELKTSITEGSSITGSPGQPVQSSDLKNSWDLRFEELFLASITTPIIYARGIEEGMREDASGTVIQLSQKSPVGGFHSVKLTRAGFQKLVNDVVRRTL